MYRGRGSKGRDQLRGLFLEGVWQCDCSPKIPAERFKVKKEGSNIGRWFYTCQRPESERCGFFLWEDDAKVREESAVLNNSRTEPQPETPKRPSTNKGSATRRSVRDSEKFDSPSKSRLPERPAPNEDGIDHKNGMAHAQNDLVDSSRPSKTTRQDVLPTPGKRKASAMENHRLVTTTPPTNRSLFKDFSDSTSKKEDEELWNLVSPETTPTPARFGEAVGVDPNMNVLQEILETLASNKLSLNNTTKAALEQVGTRHMLKSRGVMRARDLTRLALKARDAKIVELQHRIATLEAELETDRALVRHLRSEQEANTM